MRGARCGTAVGLLCAFLVAAGTAAAEPVGVLDLRTDYDARISGPVFGSGAGSGVAAAGDVNGDGREDLLVRTHQIDPVGFDRVFVVFGRDEWSDLDLASFGPGDGFVIEGTRSFGPGPASLAGAGDVNGDGLDDVIVGSPAGVTVRVGAAFVVFGKTSGAPVHVDSLGSQGFRIAGVRTEDETGRTVGGAGDVNGDGLADVVLSGPDRRTAHVVFGKTSAAPVFLATLGAGGFVFDPGDDFRDLLGPVTGVGDTNGDGLSDFIVGLPGQGREGNGRVFVLFGKSDAGAIDGMSLGEAGYQIDNGSSHVSAAAGESLAPAGDLDQDGLADFLVGAPGADNNVGGSGSVYVLFGKEDTNPLDLSSFTNGFRIDGKGVLYAAGTSVAGGEDLNRDGIPDIVVGEPEGEIDGRSSGGSAYIVFGKASPATVRLGGLNPGQVEIGGADAGDEAGSSVALGDFDADSRADVIVGAPGVDSPRISGGAAYVLFPRLLPRTLALSPPVSVNTVGDEHCVTAQVSGPDGLPATGFSVRFDVVGVNSRSGVDETDSSGEAAFCYEGGLTAGTDEIIVYADGNANGFRDPGEPGATAAKDWVAAVTGADCAVSFKGQITTQAGGRATLNGRAESASQDTSGRHSYVDRSISLRVKTRDVNALMCAEDGSAASMFGQARVNGDRVEYRIDLRTAGAAARNGSYRIRLDSGYDSGLRALRGGRIRIELL
jgi:hypothetical protein